MFKKHAGLLLLIGLIKICNAFVHPLPPDMDMIDKGEFPTPYITMGKHVGDGQFPWSAILFVTTTSDTEILCGGMLISPNDLLTAAHCVDNAKSVLAKFHLHLQDIYYDLPKAFYA